MSKQLQDNTSSPKKSKKSTKAEVDQRVTEIQTLLLQGQTRSFIQRYAKNQQWGVGEDQVDKYMTQATQIIKEINLATVQDNMALISSNLWDLYRKASKDSNLSEQHKILMSIAKLKGLDQYTVNHIIQDEREHASLSDEELNAMLEGSIEQPKH